MQERAAKRAAKKQRRKADKAERLKAIAADAAKRERAMMPAPTPIQQALSSSPAEQPSAGWRPQFIGEFVVLWFGKHNGQTIDTVPADYLRWLVENTDGSKAKLARRELRRRQGVGGVNRIVYRTRPATSFNLPPAAPGKLPWED